MEDYLTMRTQRKANDLVFISSWFLKIGVSAALAVLLPVSVSLSVPVLVFWRFRGRARGQDVIADIIKDTEEDRETVSAVACAATFHRRVASSPEVSFRSSLLIQFTWKHNRSPWSSGANCSSRGVAALTLPLSFFLSFLCRVPCRRYDRIWVSLEITMSLVVRVVWAWKTG